MKQWREIISWKNFRMFDRSHKNQKFQNSAGDSFISAKHVDNDICVCQPAP